MKDHLDCWTCGGVFELDLIVASPAEFIVDTDGVHCPFCDSLLRDISTINEPEPELWYCWYTCEI